MYLTCEGPVHVDTLLDLTGHEREGLLPVVS